METNSEHPLRVLREQLNLSIDDLAEVTGVSARTILRAEQGNSLYPESRQRICDYLQRSPNELGLLPQPRVQKRKHPVSSVGFVLLSTGINDMKRRELLRLLGLAGGALALPFSLDIDWQRLGDALSHPSRMDKAVLEDCSAVNRQFWRDFRAAANKGVVLDEVLLHLQRLTQLLHGSHSTEQHHHLCILISDLAQLAGEVCFDGNSYADATQCYLFAEGAAREANAYDLWACALTRHAFVSIYDKQFPQALPLLHVAERLAQRGDSSLVTRHWVAAVQAEAYAGVDDVIACQQALDLAEGVRDLPSGNNGAWLRFDGDRLPEERGACFTRLRQPDLAEPALRKALVLQPEQTRRRGLILSDLVLISLQQGNLEQACAYANEVAIIAQRGSGVLKKNLSTLQGQFQPFRQASVVRDLDQQIQALTTL